MSTASSSYFSYLEQGHRAWSHCVWLGMHTVQFRRKRHAPLCHPTVVLPSARMCVRAGNFEGVWEESERAVYLCLLNCVRVRAASHWASLFSFAWASACEQREREREGVSGCVLVCVCVCVRSIVCMSMTEGGIESCQVRLCQWPHKGVTEVHHALPWVL